MNNQPLSKSVKTDGANLLVHSIFQTIQGEGPFTGVPAVFVRLAGCNLRCPGCDTEYTEGATEMSIEDIFKEIAIKSAGYAATLVVITGGEPFRQNITPLVDQLHFNDIRVQIETNGVLPPQEPFKVKPVIVCSPKTSNISPVIAEIADAFKYVVDYKHVDIRDGLPITALGHKASPRLWRPPVGSKTPLYIQPMDMTFTLGEAEAEAYNHRNLRHCADSAMRFNYTVQLQVHKILNVE